MDVIKGNRIILEHAESGYYFNEFDLNLVNFFVTIIEYEKKVTENK